MSDVIDPNKLKVTELRAELQARGLDTKGNKPVLIERLKEALESESQEDETEGAIVDENEIKQDEAEPMEAEEAETNEEEPVQQDTQEEAVEENGNGHTEEEPVKEAFEEAPVEDVEGESVKETEDKEASFHEEPVKEEDPEEEVEDKSAVDLIKEDFFNGHTEELQDLEEEVDEVKEESEIKEETPNQEVKDEVVAEETLEGEDETWDHKRGRKRAASPIKEEVANQPEEQPPSPKRAKPDADVCIIAQEEEPFDQSLVVLDWYNSDLSLKIEKEKRLSATPLSDKGFAYMWHGVRGTYGYTKGMVFYEVMLECTTDANIDGEEHPYVVRVGWSVDDSSFTLGEEPRSWGYGGTGKASTNLKFKSYGCQFKVGDVVGAYLNLDVTPAVMTFTVNGTSQGIAYEINPEELDGQALFPHILTKNTQFKVNFGDEEPWAETIEGYTYCAQVPLTERIQGSQGPTKREDCEVIMMVGLPAAGKTTWVNNYCQENKHKKYSVLGTNDLIDKMKVNGLPRKRNYHGRWDQLIGSCTKCLNELLRIAYNRQRNFIIDQTNVYPSAQKRKIRGFLGFKRRAVVICPTKEDLQQRTQKREKEEGKDVPDSAVLEMKANFKLPEVGEFFDSVEFIELDKEESQKLVEQFNKEGAEANPAKYNNFSFNRGGGSRGGGRKDFNERGRDDRGHSGFRGGWDRDRDRRGGYDRRDRGSYGGNWNRNKDFGGRLTGRDGRGGYNRDRGSYNSHRGGYRDNRGSGRDNYHSSSGGGGYNKYSDKSSYNSGSNSTGYQGYSASNYNSYSNQSYSGQSYGSQGYQQQGYGNWNTGYYGQQQNYYPQQQSGYRADSQGSYGGWGHAGQTAQQTPQQAWGNTSSTPAVTPAAAAPATQQQGAWGTYQSQTTQPNAWGQTQQGYGNYYSNYNRK